MATINRKAIRAKVHRRIRKTISGTPARPRLAVHFSNRNIYAQIIDDIAGRTLCAASSGDADAGIKNHVANKENAAIIGKLMGTRALAAGITEVVFDRGGFVYHGKVKALADAAREAGLKF